MQADIYRIISRNCWYGQEIIDRDSFKTLNS